MDESKRLATYVITAVASAATAALVAEVSPVFGWLFPVILATTIVFSNDS